MHYTSDTTPKERLQSQNKPPDIALTRFGVTAKRVKRALTVSLVSLSAADVDPVRKCFQKYTFSAQMSPKLSELAVPE